MHIVKRYIAESRFYYNVSIKQTKEKMTRHKNNEKNTTRKFNQIRNFTKIRISCKCQMSIVNFFKESMTLHATFLFYDV